jgi:hypothetical protein
MTPGEGISRRCTPRVTKFDGLGRPIEVRRAVQVGATFNEQLLSRFTYFDTAPRRVVEEHLKSGTEWILTTTFLDGLGRAIRVEAPAGALTEVLRRQFDGAGNPVAVFKSSPRTGEALFWPTTPLGTDPRQEHLCLTIPGRTPPSRNIEGGRARPSQVGRARPADDRSRFVRHRYQYDPRDKRTAPRCGSNITYDGRQAYQVESRLTGNRDRALPHAARRPVKYAAY